MKKNEALMDAIGLLGLRHVASLTGRRYQAVQQWGVRGRLPRTEHTGETNYAAQIAEACRLADPHTKITRDALLGLPLSPESSVLSADLHRRAGEVAA